MFLTVEKHLYNINFLFIILQFRIKLSTLFIILQFRVIQGDTKKGNFWKTQQKLKKSKKKNLLTEIESLQLAF